jgi:hypothetical protein
MPSPELPAASRASYYLQSFTLPPELAAASRACCHRYCACSDLNPTLASSSMIIIIQSLRPPPDASRDFDHLQSFRRL